jgi:NAD(P)-dependent dehydrogenase (short-subunit alcohol dehydrogenase family)
MPTVLITGANRGIGLEFARQYAAEGWSVHATARDPGQAGDLNAIEGAVDIHRLDIGIPDQITALAAKLSSADIDLLVNNAGVSGVEHAALGEIDYSAWLEVLRINALAPLQVAEAFIPHVARSATKLMVFLTSRAGSITHNIAGSRYPYRSSKAALNSVVRSLAIDLLPQRVNCIAVHPGWARTEMGGQAAPLDPADAAGHMRELFARIEPHDSGHFLNYDGRELAW